jgi:hypothetical protein
MRLPLIGAANQYRSATVGAQTCINLYAELTEDPQERAKGIGSLYGTPGRHAFGTVANPYALWSNANRLFAIIADATLGRDEVEIDSTGAVLSSVNFTTLDDGLPAQIFSNGNQLMIVSCGLVFCDNGAGAVPCTFDDFIGTVDTAGTAVTLDSVDPSSTLIQFALGGAWDGVTITINGVDYVVASGGVIDGTHLTLTTSAGTQTGVSAVQLGDPVTALTGSYIDGYFLIQRPPGTPDLGRQWNISGILAGTSWNSLDFTSAEADPSHITSIWVDNEQVYIFKEASFQVYQNTGAGVGGFPFSIIQGAMARYGSISRWANKSMAGAVYMLGAPGGDNGGSTTGGWIAAYRLNGFTPVKISGHAQESHWNSVGLGQNAISYVYEEDGHSFWVINFGAETWAFDPEYGAWSQRQDWNGAAFVASQVFYHTFVPNWGTSGVHIVGTANGGGTGKICQSSVNFYDQEGADMAFQRAIPYIYNGGNLSYHKRMYLEMQTGTAASGTPVITRDYSDDRGATFVDAETQPIGSAGAVVRVIWPLANACESFGRIYRFSGHGQSKVVLVDLELDIEMGTT